MENYYKGKNVEEPLEKERIPIPGLPSEFVWMHVSGGSKMRNLLVYAMNAFHAQNAIVWSGSGGALSKTISCAEIMKRRFKHVHQINKICYRRFEEYWEPRMKDLDPLVVVREVPTIHILLSKEPLDENEPGYQHPLASKVPPTISETKKTEPKAIPHSHRKPRPAFVLGQFAPKGMGSSQKSKKSASSRSALHSTENQNVPEMSSENK